VTVDLGQRHRWSEETVMRLRARPRHLAASVVSAVFALGAAAQAQVQTPLPASAIPQFVDALPIPAIVSGESDLTLRMCEFKANVLPTGTFAPGLAPETWVWGYSPGPCPQATQPTYIGPVIVARRHTPTRVTFLNELGTTATSNLLAYTRSTDQTLHWADPLNAEANHCAHMARMSPGQPPTGECAANYAGPIPAVVHLHGGEVPPQLDGGPDAWFTSDGAVKGHGYYSYPGTGLANDAVYRYPNTQEAAPIWFHDHTLGATRLNVYAGLAGGYLITDPPNDPANLPPIVPLVIQDRTFDTTGQLYFHAGVPFVPNPDHPYWVPEFTGDTVAVNGKVWPFFNVEPRRYRFLFLNGSNARTYELFLTNPLTKVNGPALWQVATDGGYLDYPVRIDPNAPKPQLQRLVIMPGERADVIIDFAGLVPGTSLVVKNVAKTPYPNGATVPGSTLGRILQFRVVAGSGAADTTYNPAGGAPLRTALVRLVNPAAGVLAPGVTPSVKRQLTLNEIMGMPTVVGGVAYPGGPLEVVLNNTKWSGVRPDGSVRADFTPVTVGNVTTYYSELPGEGTTEVWEIVNLTADAHPIHTHLTQVQVLNRQGFDVGKYLAAYTAAFGGAAMPDGFGPPADYGVPNADGALGGNPAVGPFLKSVPSPPAANEAGWKDTVIMLPGQVTRIAVRFAPTDRPVGDPELFYPFEPNGGHGYVWHCHIIDHEDNEMMRPYAVRPLDVPRTFVDY
jgi:FtsP/CotA-like multicopper oxidase with cupredoxin domain